jgi:hypothetical protein
MRIFAHLAEQLAGPWLKSLVLPALVIGLLTGWHQYTKARAEASTAKEAAQVLRGRKECLSEVRLVQVEHELATERARARTALDEVAAAQRVTEEIEGHVRNLEFELSKRRPVAGSDPRCLSDGVLDAIRQGSGGGGPRGDVGTGRGGSAAKPTGKAP